MFMDRKTPRWKDVNSPQNQLPSKCHPKVTPASFPLWIQQVDCKMHVDIQRPRKARAILKKKYKSEIFILSAIKIYKLI